MTDQNGVLVEEQSEDITRKMSQLATESPKNQLLKMFSIVVSTMKVFRQNILGNVKIYKSI